MQHQKTGQGYPENNKIILHVSILRIGFVAQFFEFNL